MNVMLLSYLHEADFSHLVFCLVPLHVPAAGHTMEQTEFIVLIDSDLLSKTF